MLARRRGRRADRGLVRILHIFRLMIRELRSYLALSNTTKALAASLAFGAAACAQGGGGGPISRTEEVTQNRAGETSTDRDSACVDCGQRFVGYRVDRLELVRPQVLPYQEFALNELNNLLGDGSYKLLMMFDTYDPRKSSSRLSLHQDIECRADTVDNDFGETCQVGSSIRDLTVRNNESGECFSEPIDTTDKSGSFLNTPDGPCFSSNKVDLALDFGSIDVDLSEAIVAASYHANSRKLMQGVLRGYVQQESSGGVVLDVPGIPISITISDIIQPPSDAAGPDGWEFAFNFTASRVKVERN